MSELYGKGEMKQFLRGSLLCSRNRTCEVVSGLNVAPESENPDDFFWKSELRVYVLHALGYVNWVWY